MKNELEIQQGERFQFGENWLAFLRTINSDRILEAENSLREMLDVTDLSKRSFLDIGSGSGLFSLAARRLGAAVYSVDFDPKSVECTRELKKEFFPRDSSWNIEEASVLDAEKMHSLGRFDVVYSWGVLHHTGNLALALTNAMSCVIEGGLLFIAIYNDQGIWSKFWKMVKKTYCGSRFGRYFIISTFVPFFFLQAVAIGLLKFKNPIGYFQEYRKKRGMSIIHDWIDWLGGYPFEVATPKWVFETCKKGGFTLEKLVTTNRLGCNQFVFRKKR